MFNPYQTDKLEQIEHEAALRDITLVLSTGPGRNLMKYLFKSFCVGEMPDAYLDERLRSELIGFMRAGNSLFQLAAEADANTSAMILAEINREKYYVKKI